MCTLAGLTLVNVLHASCLLALLIGVKAVIGPSVISADGGGRYCNVVSDDQAAVAQLAVLYAYGVDSLAPGDFDGGVAILQQVFTPDASIGFCFAPGQCVNKTGPIEWAQFSSGTFTSGGYSMAHHQVSNQKVDLDSDREAGTMVSYVTASLFKTDSTSVDVYHGLYYDTVVKQPGSGAWRISIRELRARSMLRFTGAAVAT